MKKLTLLLGTAILCLMASAQKDTSVTGKRSDTIHIGKFIIIKKGGISKKNRDHHSDTTIQMGRNTAVRKRNSNVSTSWWNFDIGLSNYIDKTNYSAAGNYLVNRPGYPALGENDFKLRAGKSININIWIVNQKLNLVKHFVNLPPRG